MTMTTTAARDWRAEQPEQGALIPDPLTRSEQPDLFPVDPDALTVAPAPKPAPPPHPDQLDMFDTLEA